MENAEVERFERFLATKKISVQQLRQVKPELYQAWLSEFMGRSEAHFWQRFHFRVNAVRRTLSQHVTLEAGEQKV